ncbi:MAG: SGNH/GDSL hydrolase family protein [Deltaproteobacteria bacterium]|nr:SGNH/GDSL hydrolase family protein [Deltaproteobacteria bacterium]
MPRPPAIVRDAVLVIALTFTLVELVLRLVPTLVGDPLKSMIEEAEKVPYSNRRIFNGFHGGVRRLLPPLMKTDILVVGDSFVFGSYVKEEDIFTSLLERGLGKRVLNLGVGGTGPVQYNRMVEVGMAYEPSTVIYGVFANDFSYDAHPKIQPLKTYTGRKQEYDDDLFTASLRPNERAAHLLKWVTNLSLQYQFYKTFAQPSARFHTIPWRWKGHFFMFPTKEYWDPYISYGNRNVREGVEINRELAGAAASFAQGAKKRFWLVLFPSKEMVYAPLDPLMGPKIFSEVQYQSYEVLARELKADGVSVFDTTPDLRRLAAEGKKLYHSIDGHFNELGHAEVARLLAGLIRTPGS